MLILTRRIGEEILIHKGSITVKVLGEFDGIITLGIQAPPEIDIDRKEIYLRRHAGEQGSRS